MTPARAFVGIGSNLDGPRARVLAAMDALDLLPGCRVVLRSGLYLGAPVGVGEQPDFVNAVCAVDTTLDPHRLLAALRGLESAAGRIRDGRRGQARTLDLDLLLYGDTQIRTADLVVPHPRLHQRAFVLYPLAEIAPELCVPGHGPVVRLRAACAGQRIERLEPVET